MIFEDSNECVQIKIQQRWGWQFPGFCPTRGVILAKNQIFPKLFPELPNKSFWASDIILIRKWCAALSSVVSLGAPSGRQSASTQMCDFQKYLSRELPDDVLPQCLRRDVLLQCRRWELCLLGFFVFSAQVCFRFSYFCAVVWFLLVLLAILVIIVVLCVFLWDWFVPFPCWWWVSFTTQLTFWTVLPKGERRVLRTHPRRFRRGGLSYKFRP